MLLLISETGHSETIDNKMTWAPAIEKRANLTYPALKKIYPLIEVVNLKSTLKSRYTKYVFAELQTPGLDCSG